MSVNSIQPRGLNLPRPKPTIVPVTQENVRDWWALFVNRKAYTRQSANPHPETGRHYHYQPKNKDTGQPLELDAATVRKHLAGWITVGLYAINSQLQRCKWIAIDADYDDAFFDLGKLKGELELDGVSAALEMSRRGGHLWILCEQPLLAERCRVYIYNVALRLGVPIKGAAGLRDGIEIFPRQDRLAPGEFGNALRGPLGVHRANNHRYWFYDASSDLNSQLDYLNNLKKLTEPELTRLSLGMTIPEEFLRKPNLIELPPRNTDHNRKQFSILDFVHKPRRKASGNYYTQCPSCAQAGNDRAGDNLAISISDSRKYKCWAGCTKEMIRAAVGRPIPIRRP